MKKFLLDSFLLFTLFYIFIFILYAANMASQSSLKGTIREVLQPSHAFAPWVVAGPLAVLISAFRNKTTANKAYLIVIGFFWTLLLVFIPISLYLVLKWST